MVGYYKFMETEAFNPNNKKHLKGFVRTVRKMVKIGRKTTPKYFVIEANAFKILKRFANKIKL